MKVLVAPLNWGLGHASRCVPLIDKYLTNGDDVVLGGDGESLLLLRKHFPDLRVLSFASLELRYSAGDSQVRAMLKAVPKIVRAAIADHRMLRRYLTQQEKFDLVVSDNRFGLFSTSVRCVYMTHQLHVKLPRTHRWLEPAVAALHGWICRQYDEVWVPDYADVAHCLSGELGHPQKVYSDNIVYIGPLSRFASLKMPMRREEIAGKTAFDVVAVLSGPEPQRTMLQEDVLARYEKSDTRVLIVEGKMRKPQVQVTKGMITIVPYMDDYPLAMALAGAKKIIARSGYSTIMDLAVLGVLDKAELIPTPGQSEQMYLASLLKTRVQAMSRV